MADASHLIPSNGSGDNILGEEILGDKSIAEGCATLLGDKILSGGVNLQAPLGDVGGSRGSLVVVSSGAPLALPRTDEAVLHNASSAA